ncbi:transposase, MuDR, MULE transposase domain protein [Tanacetum coccineum]
MAACGDYENLRLTALVLMLLILRMRRGIAVVSSYNSRIRMGCSFLDFTSGVHRKNSTVLASTELSSFLTPMQNIHGLGILKKLRPVKLQVLGGPGSNSTISTSQWIWKFPHLQRHLLTIPDRFSDPYVSYSNPCKFTWNRNSAGSPSFYGNCVERLPSPANRFHSKEFLLPIRSFLFSNHTFKVEANLGMSIKASNRKQQQRQQCSGFGIPELTCEQQEVGRLSLLPYKQEGILISQNYRILVPPRGCFREVAPYTIISHRNYGKDYHVSSRLDDSTKADGLGIKSFLCYMRPLIIIDGTHLKGTYLGTNLVAVGMDGNNQIIPIATGVSQGETGESWTWFLKKLKDCISEVPNLAIISDRHYAITLACNTVFPNSFHGYCCRHLMMNCGMQSDKFKEL